MSEKFDTRKIPFALFVCNSKEFDHNHREMDDPSQYKYTEFYDGTDSK
jgi:hypothetical protein